MPSTDRLNQCTHALLAEILVLCAQTQARAKEVRDGAAMAQAGGAALGETTARLLAESMEVRLETGEMRARRLASAA